MMMTLLKNIIALAAGLLFGIGLIIAEMTNPEKVLNFLDIFGEWDPSLALVMAAALAVTTPTFWWMRKRGKPMLNETLDAPVNHAIDRRLLLGASLFGIGWGLAGYCPGPAVVMASSGASSVLIVVASMVVGMVLHRVTTKP